MPPDALHLLIERWREDEGGTYRTWFLWGERRAGLGGPVCLAVHPVFGSGAYEELLRSGAREVVTCNTIPHLSNGIDVVPLLARGLTDWLAGVTAQ